MIYRLNMLMFLNVENLYLFVKIDADMQYNFLFCFKFNYNNKFVILKLF